MAKRLPSSGQVRAWLASLHPLWEDESLVLCSQTEFGAAHVRAWYLEDLMVASSEVFGMPCPVRVECRPAVFASFFTPEDAKQNAGDFVPVKDDSLPAVAYGKNSASCMDFTQNGPMTCTQGGMLPAQSGPGAPVPTGLQVQTDVADRQAFASAFTSAHAPAQNSAPVHALASDKAMGVTNPDSPRALYAASGVIQPDSRQSFSDSRQAGSGFLHGDTPPPRPALVCGNTLNTAPAPRPLPAIQLSLPAQQSRPDTSASNTPDWRFSFEDFVVGPCNAFAYEASRSMCSHTASSNVLFLSSAPGLGKTHLIQAVGKKLGEVCNRRRPQMEYLTAEAFASAFYQSLKTQTTDSFKSHYRNLDLLLLEDLHFLQGKEKMQAEFLETLKALGDKGSKVVFTSSFAPRDLKFMDEQLQSRLASGLLTFIERPDEETRRKILRKKASVHQVLLPEDVEDVLVRHIQADIRQLESCLHNLILKAKLLNSRITSQMVWEVISQYASHSPVLNMDSIIVHVCRGFGLSKDQLMSASRKQNYVTARNAAFFLARKHTDFSFEAIGRVFNRKHSTVIKGITALEREMSRKTPEGAQITNVLAMIERNGNLF
ncbi:hypothetical protein LJC46_06415 [Desulfovibrio sp. OttesenSCG-928-G15]|nr:hypothetical protein [Desulfovibrio sp. OttesenSCG-928-G15]